MRLAQARTAAAATAAEEVHALPVTLETAVACGAGDAVQRMQVALQIGEAGAGVLAREEPDVRELPAIKLIFHRISR